MVDKRNIEITAKTKEGFEKVEQVLDLISDSFLKNIRTAKSSNFSDTTITFENEFYSTQSRGDYIIPMEAEGLNIKFEHIEKGGGLSSDLYKVQLTFHIKLPIEKGKFYFIVELTSYSPFKEFKSTNMLKEIEVDKK